MNDRIRARLQLTLLDRLTDTTRGEQKDRCTQQNLDTKGYLQNISCDLGWLLGSVSLESTENLDHLDFEDEAKKPRNYLKESVLNFGITPLAGQRATGIDPNSLKNHIHEVITRFEPRILPDTLKITVNTSDEYNDNAMTFDIWAEIWMQPDILQRHWQSKLDLETGVVEIK